MSQSNLPFTLDFLASPQKPWGPSKEVPSSLRFHDIPYAPFSKSDKLGKASDWSGLDAAGQQSQHQQGGRNQKRDRDPFHAYGASSASKFAAADAADSTGGDFEIVDNKAPGGASSSSGPQGHGGHQQHGNAGGRTVLRGRGGSNLGRGGRSGANSGGRSFQQRAPTGGAAGNLANKRPINAASAASAAAAAAGGNSASANKPQASSSAPQTAQQQRVSYWNTQNQNQVDDASKRKRVALEVKPNFFKISDIEFNKLTKLNLDLKSYAQGETLAVRANPALVKLYNKSFDKLSSSSNLNKKTIPLKVFSREVPESYVDTLQDDVLVNYAKDNTADVVITDKILATIMASHKSNFPWSVKISKDTKTGKLYFAQTENNDLDQPLVDENDSDAFFKSFHMDESNINSYVKLSNELQVANSNLTKFVSSSSTNEKIEGANVASGETNASIQAASDLKTNKIYKYKLFKVPEVTHVEEHKKNTKLSLAKQEEAEPTFINIVVRTEADLLQKPAFSNGSGAVAFETISVHALNQYKPSPLDWKTKLISNRGAIISTELRKNNNLFSKWILSSLLGDIDSIKLGFLARDSFANNAKHSVLGIFNYKPEDLARQSNLKTGNGWAIFKSIVDIVNHEADLVKDGKDNVEFVLLKDPSNAKLTIYRVD